MLHTALVVKTVYEYRLHSAWQTLVAQTEAPEYFMAAPDLNKCGKRFQRVKLNIHFCGRATWMRQQKTLQHQYYVRVCQQAVSDKYNTAEASFLIVQNSWKQKLAVASQGIERTMISGSG